MVITHLHVYSTLCPSSFISHAHSLSWRQHDQALWAGNNIASRKMSGKELADRCQTANITMPNQSMHHHFWLTAIVKKIIIPAKYELIDELRQHEWCKCWYLHAEL